MRFRSRRGRRLVLICSGASVMSGSCSVETDLLATSEQRERSRCSVEGEVGEWEAITPPDVEVDAEGALVRVVMDPESSSVIYLATRGQGVWKTEDCGAQWERVNTGINGPVIQDSLPWGFAHDRFAPETLYLGPRFSARGLWWSTNGGVHWEEIPIRGVSEAVSRYGIAHVARVAVSPFSAHHLLITSVDPWTGEAGNGETDAGVFEGRYDEDDETWQWVRHDPSLGMGRSQRIAFGEDEATWYLAPPEFSGARGTFRTIDGGESFHQLDDQVAALRGFQMYRAEDGALYRTGATGLFRSDDDGDSWVDVFEGLGIGGTQAVVGDGERLYVAINSRSSEAIPRLYTTFETTGDRDWAPYLEQVATFNFGPFVFDDGRGLLYSIAEGRGVFRMAID